jgi:hypothetical protein
VRYVEVKEPSKLSKLASYLGMKTVENCYSSGGCNCVSSSNGSIVKATPSTQAEIVASAIKATAQSGGSSIIKTGSDGSTNITYNSGK